MGDFLLDQIQTNILYFIIRIYVIINTFYLYINITSTNIVCYFSRNNIRIDQNTLSIIIVIDTLKTFILLIYK